MPNAKHQAHMTAKSAKDFMFKPTVGPMIESLP